MQLKAQKHILNHPIFKKLSRQEQTPAQPVIQLNPFFAHPDQLLLAMCSDDDDISIRLLAICYHSEKTARLMNS